MPKMKWGSGVTADTINNAEEKGITVYDGPLPPKGVYGWDVKFLKTGETSNKNPQLIIGLELNPRDREDHQAFKGFFVQDFIVVKDTTAWRLKPFLKALGVSAKDFLENTVTDEEGRVTKIGTLDLTKRAPGIIAMLQVNRGQNKEQYPREVGSYVGPMAGSKTSGSSSSEAKTGDADSEEAPF